MKKKEKLKIGKINKEFPKMVWLGNNSLFERAMFVENDSDFVYLIGNISYLIRMEDYYEQSI